MKFISMMELNVLDNKHLSKLDKFSEKYTSIIIALSSLAGVISGWGHNWVMTGVSGLGVLVFGTIGFFDIRREACNKK